MKFGLPSNLGERSISGNIYGRWLIGALAPIYLLVAALGLYTWTTHAIMVAVGLVLAVALLLRPVIYRRPSISTGFTLADIGFNLAVHTVTVYATGSAASPALLAYGPIVAGFSLFMGLPVGLAISVFSALSVATLGALEYRGLLPHMPLYHDGTDPGLFMKSGYVITAPIVVLAYTLLVSYVAGHLVLRLRAREGQLREEEERRWASLGQLSAVVAHEIKNPLAAIRGAAGLVEREKTPPSIRNEMLDTIRQETDRLDRLVRQYLDFSKPEPPKFQTVSLNGVLERSLQGAADTDGAASPRVHSRLSPNDPRVWADPDQIHQAFLNVLQNARHAAGAGGQVWVETEGPTPQGVEVRISDSGPGIPPEASHRIFEPFFTTKARGSGLGLAIVRRIMESHGGSVSVHPREGGGTTFVFRLKGATA
ncbi:MAG: hypothetical protein HYY13_08200 [Nitrospirae bacterium]|nr:hypothetical protein [Nitrospirota bacterium]